MNIRNEFDRIGHLFHNGVHKTQKASEDWADKRVKQASCVAQKVRDQVDLRKFVTTEEAIVAHVRENPALYLLGAALVIGALIARLIMESRKTRQAPLL
jgi:hypothetical protein